MRQALINAVTPQDIADIAAKLLEKAKQGDVPAAKVVLSYTLGKPTSAVDPDSLDQQELKTLADNHVACKYLQRVMQRLPIEMVLGLLHAVLPALDRATATKFHDLWTTLGAEMDQKRACADEDDEVEAEPVTNDECEDEGLTKPESLEETLREWQVQSEVLKAYLGPKPAPAESSNPSRPPQQPAEPASDRLAPSTNGSNGKGMYDER